MTIEPLEAQHDRTGFDCGVDSLNTYLKRYARQNADRDLGVTYVGVAAPGNAPIQGYYTLVTGAVARETMPQERQLPRYPVPVVLLGRLAVDVKSQGRGVGRQLLLDALYRSAQTSQQVGLYAVVVDALDPQAAAFYAKYGFQVTADDPLRLYMTIKTVRALGLV